MIDKATPRPEGFPELAWHGFRLYVLFGTHPGHGLRALLEGNLFEVFRRGDEEFLKGLEVMVRYLDTSCPYGCFGSPERVRCWIEVGGLEGLLTT